MTVTDVLVPWKSTRHVIPAVLECPEELDDNPHGQLCAPHVSPHPHSSCCTDNILHAGNAENTTLALLRSSTCTGGTGKLVTAWSVSGGLTPSVRCTGGTRKYMPAETNKNKLANTGLMGNYPSHTNLTKFMTNFDTTQQVKRTPSYR